MRAQPVKFRSAMAAFTLLEVMVAVAILAIDDAGLREKLIAYRTEQTERVLHEDMNGESAAWSERTSER